MRSGGIGQLALALIPALASTVIGGAISAATAPDAPEAPKPGMPGAPMSAIQPRQTPASPFASRMPMSPQQRQSTALAMLGR